MLLRSQYGNTMQAASAGGHKDIVLLLLEHQADVNMQGGQYGSALQAASAEGQRDIVLLLLKHKAASDIDMQSGYHGNLLQVTSPTDHETMVEAKA